MWLKRKGWSDGLLYEQSLVRKSTFIIASAFNAKISQLERAWPNPFEKEKAVVVYGNVPMAPGQARILQLLKGQKRKRKKTNG